MAAPEEPQPHPRTIPPHGYSLHDQTYSMNYRLHVFVKACECSVFVFKFNSYTAKLKIYIQTDRHTNSDTNIFIGVKRTFFRN